MSCQKIGRTIRKAMSTVDEKVLLVADEVIAITGKIKDLSESPTVQAIEAALGAGAAIPWIDAALNIAYKLEQAGQSLAEKFKVLLDEQPTQTAKEGVLAKVAAVAAKEGDARNLPDHVYDQAVTIAIARTKVPD